LAHPDSLHSAVPMYNSYTCTFRAYLSIARASGVGINTNIFSNPRRSTLVWDDCKIHFYSCDVSKSPSFIDRQSNERPHYCNQTCALADNLLYGLAVWVAPQTHYRCHCRAGASKIPIHSECQSTIPLNTHALNGKARMPGAVLGFRMGVHNFKWRYT